MGTRGLIGIRYQGKDYLTYNHFDSYPKGLGVRAAKFFRYAMLKKNFNSIIEQVKNLKLVNERATATEEDIKACAETTDLTVSKQTVKDYYCLLRDCQGDLFKYLEVGIMIDNSVFIKDSLFCEYAYIINLDEKTLEFYKGYQKNPHNKGRYASKEKIDGYYPCALVKTYKKSPRTWFAK